MSPSHSPLLGRQTECEALDGLVAGVREGQSRVLVLRGEAGVGKTALLEYLSTRAAGCRVARAAGVESEMELPFAGLHALCAPMLSRLRHLPGPQRAALSTAFGLEVAPPPDRFVVGTSAPASSARAAKAASTPWPATPRPCSATGSGRYEAALEGAARGSEASEYGYAAASLPELVEAAVRRGRPEVAAAALSRLEERARAAGTDWALGVLARAQALVHDDEALFVESIGRLSRTRVGIELARARLLYGEWLRRQDRGVDARDQLRLAHDAFFGAGAEAFAERARRELVATGDTVPRRTIATRDVLTPQEEQIARMARDGQSNPEIGAQLFISPRTVEYHLRKVFTKLGITSRKDLSAALTIPG
jgi:DNA-binding CsgD family transcriptional regulator